MVTYVLLCLLRPELVGKDVEASSHEGRRRVSNFHMNGLYVQTVVAAIVLNSHSLSSTLEVSQRSPYIQAACYRRSAL
jgi:hypothetical protein